MVLVASLEIWKERKKNGESMALGKALENHSILATTPWPWIILMINKMSNGERIQLNMWWIFCMYHIPLLRIKMNWLTI